MSGPKLVSLHLRRFKSYENQVFPISDLTLVIGRNGSGKSNALDALAMLALLADGRDLSDMERGDQEVAGLRGGLTGAAPFGKGEVEVGAEVILSDGSVAELNLVLDPRTSEVQRETLTLSGVRPKTLIDAKRTGVASGLAEAQVYSGGAPKTVTFLSGRLAVAQAATRIATDSKSRRLVVRVASEVIDTLTGVFVLDPLPARMREYSRVGTTPDRSGASLSAQMFDLKKSDPDAWRHLVGLVRGVVGSNLEDLDFSRGRLDIPSSPTDVMVALVEKSSAGKFPVLATNMSDGTLRYLAILTTLLARPAPRVSANLESEVFKPRTLLVEEVENGLFPDQAAQILHLMRVEAARVGLTLIATTHSPALLDALEPDDHGGVVVAERDEKGRGTLTPLVQHRNYVRIAETGRVGTALSQGALTRKPTMTTPLSLEELLS